MEISFNFANFFIMLYISSCSPPIQIFSSSGFLGVELWALKIVFFLKKHMICEVLAFSSPSKKSLLLPLVQFEILNLPIIVIDLIQMRFKFQTEC